MLRPLFQTSLQYALCAGPHSCARRDRMAPDRLPLRRFLQSMFLVRADVPAACPGNQVRPKAPNVRKNPEGVVLVGARFGSLGLLQALCQARARLGARQPRPFRARCRRGRPISICSHYTRTTTFSRVSVPQPRRNFNSVPSSTFGLTAARTRFTSQSHSDRCGTCIRHRSRSARTTTNRSFFTLTTTSRVVMIRQGEGYDTQRDN